MARNLGFCYPKENMMRLSLLVPLLLFLTASCSQTSTLPPRSFYSSTQKPLASLEEVEDTALSTFSKEAAQSLTTSILSTLQARNRILLTSSNSPLRQFSISIELVEQENEQNHLTTHLFLRILDKRSHIDKVILQETLAISAPIQNLEESFEDPHFDISPLGLAYAKLAREVSGQIEDYILLSARGV